MIQSLLTPDRGEIACRIIRTARLWDDGIIDPAQTRDVLGLALAATLNALPRTPVSGSVPTQDCFERD